jgi:hypothetical protein
MGYFICAVAHIGYYCKIPIALIMACARHLSEIA